VTKLDNAALSLMNIQGCVSKVVESSDLFLWLDCSFVVFPTNLESESDH